MIQMRNKMIGLFGSNIEHVKRQGFSLKDVYENKEGIDKASDIIRAIYKLILNETLDKSET